VIRLHSHCPPQILCYRVITFRNCPRLRAPYSPIPKRARMDQDLIKRIKDLVQLDTDASYAYEKAIDSIEVPLVKEQLIAFRGDHERHIRELSAYLRSMGEEPPESKPDIKGYFIEGFTALRSATGTEGALKAMKSNEKLTNSNYDDARKTTAPAELATLLEANYQDERRHLEYIEQALRDRIWE
jgi:rubrerythrin